MLDACLDLLLGSSCAVCGTYGRVLCESCAADLPTRGVVTWPTPAPDGLATPVAVGEYAGALKLLVNAHKERQQFSLARPLGTMLAHAVRELAVPPGEPWILVPVPSRGAVVRMRGHDPMLRVSRHAAALLRRWGYNVSVARVLASVTVRDQAGLGADERAANLAGTMSCAPSGSARLRQRWPGARLVVADDVITTGFTAREAQRALEDSGLEVAGIAAVAATRRRRAPLKPGRDSGAALPFSDRGD